jgi:YidC/Oxa1 family membrane protein insertase
MWNTIVVSPMINALLFIYGLLGENFGLAIILFTLLVRLATHPLMSRQLKSSAALQDLQQSKKWQDMQKKFKDDKEKLAQEQMKLYQEAGVNPLGSCLPTLIQFPIIIGLYQAVIAALAASPVQLLNFSESLYKLSPDNPLYNIFPNPGSIIPINSQFLWMDLGQPERLMIPGIPFGISLLAVLVVITSFLQTRLMTPASPGGDANAQAQAMTKMMGLYFPLFIGYLTWTYAAGLGLYFVASNLFTIGQYAAMGRLDLKNILPQRKETANNSANKSAKNSTKKSTNKSTNKNGLKVTKTSGGQKSKSKSKK